MIRRRFGYGVHLLLDLATFSCPTLTRVVEVGVSGVVTVSSKPGHASYVFPTR